MSLLREAAKGARRRLLWPAEVPRRFRPAFRALRPGSVAIDCGANVGRYTALMAERAGEVYAFEPDPAAFAVLERRFAGVANVRCLRQAVSDRDGSARLYLHEDAAEDPVRWSVGSSLVAAKGNVREDTFVEVETVDLDAFVARLGRRVALLKLDVEGAELPVLRSLLGSGRIALVDHVLVEMHDLRVPELRAEGEELRREIERQRLRHVRLDWD
jgi:FkbM family methyltransferase